MVAPSDALNGEVLTEILRVVRRWGRGENACQLHCLSRALRRDDHCAGQHCLGYDVSPQLCGEGACNVPCFIDALAQAGYDSPLGLEILSGAFQQLPLKAAAQRSFDRRAVSFWR